MKLILRFLIVFGISSMLCLDAFAQSTPPPPPGNHNSNTNQPPGGGAPLGEGIATLVLLGFGYAAKKAITGKPSEKKEGSNEQPG